MVILKGCRVSDEIIKENATKVGLNVIDFDVEYDIIKVGVKKPSSLGVSDEGTILRDGIVSIVGDKDHAWIYIESPTNWFKTSNVLSCKKTETGYEIETRNSFYKLVNRDSDTGTFNC